MSERILDNQVHESVYQRTFPPLYKSLAVFCLLFLTVLIVNFPLGPMVGQQIDKALERLPCPLQLKDQQLTLFLPAFKSQEILIPASCLPRGASGLKLENFSLTPSWPSLSPVGFSTHTGFGLEQTPFSLYQSFGLGQFVLTIKEQPLPFSIINQFIPQYPYLAGESQLNLKFSRPYRSGGAPSVNFRLSSENFQTIPFSLLGMNIPALEINALDLQLRPSSPAPGNQEYLLDLTLGAEQSPLQGEVTGKLNLNWTQLPFSAVDLKAQLRVGDAVLEQFSLLKNFLDGRFNKEGEFYQINISGTLGTLQFTTGGP